MKRLSTTPSRFYSIPWPAQQSRHFRNYLMGERSLSFCNVVAIWSETLLYGIFFAVSITVVRFLSLREFHSHRKTSFNQVYMAATFTLFTLATIHVTAGLAMFLEAFMHVPNLPNDFYFVKTNTPLNLIRIATSLGSIVLADVIVIHRVYILWDRTLFITLVPLFNLLLFVISGIVLLVLSSTLNISAPSPTTSVQSIQLSTSLPPALRLLNPLYLGLSFTTNLSIIILASVAVYRERPKRTENGLELILPWRCLIFIARTGLLFPFTSLICLLLTVAQSNGQVIPRAALTQIAGIIPSLMILAGNYPEACPMIPSTQKPQCQCCRSTVAENKLSLGICSPRASYKDMRNPNAIPPGSAGLPNTGPPKEGLPLLTQTPSLVPETFSTKRRLKEPPTPLIFYSQPEPGPESPPPAPRTPEPRHRLPSPYETHFPRDKGRHVRISQQTFNTKRDSAGKGRTAFTTFGNSDFARKLVLAKEGEILTPTFPKDADSTKKVKALKKRNPENATTASADREHQSGVHMIKAVERRTDYLDEKHT